MPTRSLNVQITGDSRDFEKAVKRSSGAMDKFGKETSLHTRLTSGGFSRVGIAARGMTAGIGAAAVGVGYLTKQFVDSQKVSKQTDAVLKSTGGVAGVTAKQVSDLATAISRKTGIDDEAIQSGENLLLTFTNVRNETGRGNAVFTRATRTIADMSAALGQDTKSSAIQLGKALNDPIKGVTALQRVGVSFTASQKEQIKTLVDSGKTLDAQKLILRELNKEFGGSAAAQATPFDKLKVSAGNLAETLGGALAPSLGKAAGFASRFLNQMQDGTGTGGRFVHAMQAAASTLKNAWGTAVAAVTRFIKRNREDIQGVIAALRSLGRFFSSIFGDVIVPAVRAAIGPIREILGGVVQSLRGVIRIITGIVTGDWRRVWKGIKDVVVGAFNQLKGTFDLIARSLGPALVKLAGKLIAALVRGLGGLAGALKDAIVHGVRSGVSAATGAVGDVISSLNPFGDGIGKLAKSVGDGVGGTLSAPGGAVNLMGADPDLLPFAAIGARMGLHVSSGLRPGAITSSGNVSFHASGDAIDEAGPPSAMMRFFRTMKGTFGSRLRELIYTPGGVGIKDGRPFRYTGQVAADHYDHVHVAYTGPFGDGIGQAVDAAYKAGFRGPSLIRMVAIAGRESGYDAQAKNLKYPDHSIGMWQINQLAHHGRYGTDAQLMNAYVNARAAWAISGHGRNFAPWSTNRGLSQGWLSKAARAVGSYLNSGHSGGGGGGGGAGQTHTHSADIFPTKFGPGGPMGYEAQTALAGVHEAKARASDDVKGLIRALVEERRIKRRRLRRVKKLLRGRLTRAHRTALLQEEATLVGEIGDLSGTIREYRADVGGGAMTISRADELDAGVDPNAVTPGGLAGGTGGGGSTDDGSAALAAEIRALRQSLDATRQLAQKVQSTENFQLKKYLADVLGGQIVGYGVVGRSFTPGTGVEHSY